MKSDNNGEENTEEEEEEKDIDENEEEEEEEEVSELIGLVKRVTKYCGTMKNAKISVTDKNYKYGIKRYKDAGTVKTVLKEISGYGPKAKFLGIDVTKLLARSNMQPTYNAHDICYGCHVRSRKNCDDLFLLNMEEFVLKYFQKVLLKKVHVM